MKTGEISQGFVYDTEEKINVRGLENSAAKLIPKNSVIVALYGDGYTAGSVAINKLELTTNQACCNLIVDPEKCHYAFLYYYLKGSYNNLVSLKSGGSQQNLNAQTVRSFPVQKFDLPSQKRIAAILSAYDELIETNQRRIALLEKLAEEIYREWFVRLRFPGHENVKKIKGVPEGWGSASLSSLGSFLNGYAFKPSDWCDDGIPIIKIKEMNSGVSVETPRNSGDNVPAKYHFDDGAIIFSWSGTLLVMLWDQGPGLLNQHLFKVDPAGGIPKSFLYFAIKFAIPIFVSLTTGATMQHIKRRELDFVQAKVPPSTLLKRYDDMVAPLLAQKLILTKANRHLTRTRDLLLPRLISGKLAVEDLEIAFPPGMAEEEVSETPRRGGRGEKR